MSMYIEYQRNNGWASADTSDPEARWIMGKCTLVRRDNPLPPDYWYGNYDEDIHIDLYSLDATQVPAIRRYLIDKGQAYREGMDAMLNHIDNSGEATLIRFMD